MRRISTSDTVKMVESNIIDELDRQLAQCLTVDGRASFSQIAAVLGVSDQTIARRYRRLRSIGALRVVGLPPAKAHGSANWFLRLRCVPGSGEAIAAALARRADTAWVQLMSGDTEVLCSLRGNSREGSESLLARLPRSSRIVAVTVYSRLHMFSGFPGSSAFLHVLPAERVWPLLRKPTTPTTPPAAYAGTAAHDGHAGTAGHTGTAEPGKLDAALLAALALDGRAPYADLASATGWSETTVRRRVDQLRDAGTLYFDLEVDLPLFGFRTTWLWLSVPPSHLEAVGSALAQFAEVAYAAATTGPANLAACVVCRDEAELYEFLTRKVGALPGVERVETAPVIRTVKQASPLMVPAIRPPIMVPGP
jgi:DNA-binding Lrp family transcriptional regulator